jgi:chemotaxis protein MotC
MFGARWFLKRKVMLAGVIVPVLAAAILGVLKLGGQIDWLGDSQKTDDYEAGLSESLQDASHPAHGEVADGTKEEVIPDADKALETGHEAKDDEPEGHGSTEATTVVFTKPTTSPLVAKLRVLQGIQDRLAAGDATAVPLQRDSLISIEKEINGLRAGPLTLPDAYAATTYLLSGGRPGAVTSLAARSELPKSAKRLIEGALSYANGDPISASEKLHEFVPSQFPAMLAGHLTLVQARVVEDLTDQQRIALLMSIVNALPGTLLEEASLRRILELSASSLQVDVFERAVKRYQRRFSNSLYNNEYRIAVVAGIVSFEAGKRPIPDLKLDGIVFSHAGSRRDNLLQSLTEAGLRKGYQQLCRYAASRQRRLAPEKSPDWARATTYLAACGVIEADPAPSDHLSSLDVSLLSPKDLAVHQAAMQLADRVRLADSFEFTMNKGAASSSDLPQEIELLQEFVNESLKEIATAIEASK